ncbi:hypothetical protein KUCAC02_027387, partial [Chaenocephalus aceratus]
AAPTCLDTLLDQERPRGQLSFFSRCWSSSPLACRNLPQLEPANNHSCYQSEHSQKKPSDNAENRKNQAIDSTQDQTGLKGFCIK